MADFKTRAAHFLRRTAQSLSPSLSRRSYEAASQSPRMMGLRASHADGNSEALSGVATMRDRSRKMERDQAFAKKAIRQFALDQVGEGIRPQFVTGADKTERILSELWDSFAEQCDPLNGGTFYGLQFQGVAALARDGGVLSRKRPRRLTDTDFWGRRLAVPLQLQMLEMDHLDISKDGTVAASQGGVIVGGIELDAAGRRSGYWLYRQHPASVLPFQRPGALNSVFVPYTEIAHTFCYNESRPGQIIGAPWLHAAITRLYDFDGWVDATMHLRRQTASAPILISGGDAWDEEERLAAGFPQGKDEYGNDIPQRGAVDNRGYPVETWQPGLAIIAPPGRKIEVPTLPVVPGHEETTRVTLREIAAAAGMSYEALSNDLSGSNYVSLRLGRIERRQLNDAFREQVTIPLFCKPTGYWFLDTVQLAGLYRPTRDPVKTFWIAKQAEDVDELLRVKIIAAKIRNNLMSWDEAVIGEGCDPEQLAQEIKRSNERRDTYNIVGDCDARQMTAAGQPVNSKPAGQKPPITKS
jgi:lambda family phage portal protein